MGGLYYQLNITDDGTVSLHVIGGSTPKGSFTPGWSDDPVEFGMRDRNYFDNGMVVFRKAGEILFKYMTMRKPHMLSFSSNNDRKSDI